MDCAYGFKFGGEAAAEFSYGFAYGFEHVDDFLMDSVMDFGPGRIFLWIHLMDFWLKLVKTSPKIAIFGLKNPQNFRSRPAGARDSMCLPKRVHSRVHQTNRFATMHVKHRFRYGSDFVMDLGTSPIFLWIELWI